IALLLNKEEATDSRVLKTAASLRDAGAEVRIVSAARPGHPAGTARASNGGSGLDVYRVSDLDLVRLLPWLAAAVRRFRGAAAAHRDAAAVPPAAPADAAVPTEPPPRPRPTPKALLADAWMRLYQALRLSWYWLGAVRHLTGWKPDAVHANDGNTLAPAVMLRALVGSRVVYDSHELWRHRNVRQDRLLAPAMEAMIERLGVRASSGVITVSPSIVEWLRRRYRLAQPPTLVRNIPHRRGPVPAPQNGRLRELAALPKDTLVIAYCGGVTTGRGLEETVDALAELPGHAHLVMLGPIAPAYLDGLLRRAREAGVAERVHAVGTVPSAEVPEALADADVSVVFVRPICLSYRYSLPNKLFESIHAGLPVVAADLPDTAAVVRHYGVGEVFGPERPDQLAEAILRVVSEGEQYRTASRAAADDLDWENESAALVGLYRRVLEGDR
ncbi:glycosyltransferase, partial [Pseudactinotalea suaedae]